MNPSSATRTDILNPDLGSRKDELARQFREADPFPHVVISDLFAPQLAQRLSDDFPSFEERYARGETGEVGRKAAHRNVRDISDTFREVDEFIQTPEFLDLMSDISGIPGLMYDPEYYGGGTHENVDGASLYPHVDFNYHPKGWHRRLNLIVYLSSEWKAEWGGNLELHSNPWKPNADEIKAVPAAFNRGILFETSEHSWHGFPPIKLPEDRRHLSRKSFAIYLYTIDRPAEQTAASHSTIYVPFGIPEDIRPGSVLTSEQHDTLRVRFDEYRGMLKYQYDRQLKQSEDFSRAYRMELQGYATQTRAPAGRWPDTWVSSEFSLEFTPTRPVRGLNLDVAIPPKMEADQLLEIRAGDWSGTEVLQPGEQRTLELPLNVEAGQTTELAIHASATWSPGGADKRELAYRIISAALDH